MKNIKNEIEYKENRLKELKEKLKVSFESVKEHWNTTYHRDFTDKCEMVYLLLQGLKYSPYSFSKEYKIERAKEWKKDTILDYCNIYKGFGSPIGFISLKSGLYDATRDKHKEMWQKAIEYEREIRGFEDFKKQLKKDFKFLTTSFENYIRERSTGAYSNDPYLIEFEERRLRTGKYYIYIEGTSRNLRD